MSQHQPFHLWRMPVKPQGRAQAVAHYNTRRGYAMANCWHFTWAYPVDPQVPPGPAPDIYPPPFHRETPPTREAVAYLEAIGFKVYIDHELQGAAAEPFLDDVARLFEAHVRRLRLEVLEPLTPEQVAAMARSAAEMYIKLQDVNALRGLPDYVQRAIDVLIQGYRTEQSGAVGDVANLSAGAAPRCAGVPFSDDDIPF